MMGYGQLKKTRRCQAEANIYDEWDGHGHASGVFAVDGTNCLLVIDE